MTESFLIRPANPDGDIRCPDTGERLPADGAHKPRNAYWIGLEMRGEVIAVAPEPTPEPKPRKS